MSKVLNTLLMILAAILMACSVVMALENQYALAGYYASVACFNVIVARLQFKNE